MVTLILAVTIFAVFIWFLQSHGRTFWYPWDWVYLRYDLLRIGMDDFMTSKRKEENASICCWKSPKAATALLLFITGKILA